MQCFSLILHGLYAVYQSDTARTVCSVSVSQKHTTRSTPPHQLPPYVMTLNCRECQTMFWTQFITNVFSDQWSTHFVTVQLDTSFLLHSYFKIPSGPWLTRCWWPNIGPCSPVPYGWVLTGLNRKSTICVCLLRLRAGERPELFSIAV
jgi:hypothetical protein